MKTILKKKKVYVTSLLLFEYRNFKVILLLLWTILFSRLHRKERKNYTKKLQDWTEAASTKIWHSQTVTKKQRSLVIS